MSTRVLRRLDADADRVRSGVIQVRIRPLGDVRRKVTVDEQLPEALESIARSLRAGASLPMAVAEVGRALPAPVGEQLLEIAGNAARGRSLVVSIDEWAQRTSGESVGLVAAALSLAAEVGGAAARSLDGVADTLRDREAARREVRALSTQARASALVIGLGPVAFAFIVLVTDPSSAAFLVSSPIGFVCLASGVALDALGAVWMRAIVRRAAADSDAVRAQQADVVDLFVLAIGAGLNLRLALDAVAHRTAEPWASGWQAVVAQVERGQALGDALDALPATLGPASRPLARALAGADRYGTPLLPALERLATEARTERRHRAAEAARRVPVRLLFPLVLCVLPAFGLLTVAPLLAGALDALRL